MHAWSLLIYTCNHARFVACFELQEFIVQSPLAVNCVLKSWKKKTKKNLWLIFCSLIRDSGPHINNIIIVGCLVMLVTCFLLGVDSSNPDTDEYVGNGNDDNILEFDIIAGRNRRYATICMVSVLTVLLNFLKSLVYCFAHSALCIRMYNFFVRKYVA